MVRGKKVSGRGRGQESFMRTNKMFFRAADVM